MKSELDQVIEFYENERASLENLIKDALPEWDYLHAHYHSLALQAVNGRLQVLYNLRDPNYERKSHLNFSKDYFERLTQNSKHELQKELYLKRLNEIKEEISALEQTQKKFSVDGQELDDALFDLVEQKIKTFRLHLKKSSNFYIDFSIAGNEMIITLTPNQDVTEDYLITEDNSKSIESIGFILNDISNRFELKYSLAQFRNTIELKTILARLVFEVFYYKEFDTPASIEFEQ